MARQSVGGKFSNIYGSEVFNKLNVALEEMNAAVGLAGGSLVNTYVDTIRDEVPNWMKEKIYADVVLAGGGQYQVIFRSRGEPGTSGKRVIFNVAEAKFASIKESASADVAITRELDKAVVETLPALEEAMDAISEQTAGVIFERNGITFESRGVGSKFRAPAGGVVINGIPYSGGQFIPIKTEGA